MAISLDSLFSLRGKVALVTGGSRGIGEMIAAGLVAAGAKVYIAARKKAECDEAIARLGAGAIALSADLGTQAGTRALAEEIAAREPKLHVLVNNAGANWGAPLHEFPESGWDKVLSLNLKAVFDLTRFLVPQLEAAAAPGDPARVINVGSIDGIQVPLLETYAYSASKAAVHHMSAVLAKKLAPRITVNAIAPGPFESKMMHETLEKFGDGIKKSCPMKRIGEPEDMAGIAVYLASRAGAYVTGATIPVDGGISTTR
ncbi:MAG TPA: SDR family NAD(P)-dependent oxidoreductase [Myxococcota bacterium]|nr:SDR family NAD(P)-dependent oxidoreductase [Myxococcota bacterium]